MKRIMMIMALVMMASTAWAQVSLDVVWTDLSFGGGTTNVAPSVAFNRNRVIAGEALGNASGGISVHVKGYNATTGNLAWDDILDGSSVFVDASGNDAFAAVGPVGGVLIRSYAQRTGDIQWSTTVALRGARAFAVRGNRVLVAGNILVDLGNGLASLNGRLFVLDRATGAILWSATLDALPVPAIDSVFLDFDRTGTDLIVVGQRERLSDSSNTLILRDYRVSDGHLKWERIEPDRVGSHVVSRHLCLSNYTRKRYGRA